LVLTAAGCQQPSSSSTTVPTEVDHAGKGRKAFERQGLGHEPYRTSDSARRGKMSPQATRRSAEVMTGRYDPKTKFMANGLSAAERYLPILN
jgi:hypothetical protein